MLTEHPTRRLRHTLRASDDDGPQTAPMAPDLLLADRRRLAAPRPGRPPLRVRAGRRIPLARPAPRPAPAGDRPVERGPAGAPRQPDALAAGVVLDRRDGLRAGTRDGAASRSGDPPRIRRSVPRTALDRQAGSRAGAGALPGARFARRPGCSRSWSAPGASPGATIRQILSYDAAGEVVELKRNLRVLSAMATLGPLLGLLGTVVGIIQSFDALGGRVGPSRGEALAHGISLALVATAIGLAIAIVSVAFYYVFLNRVDVLVRELDDSAPAGHRAGLGRGATARPDGSAPPAARRRPTPIRQESRVLLSGRSEPWKGTPMLSEPGAGRRAAGHQHDADGRRHPVPAGLLHGRHAAV